MAKINVKLVGVVAGAAGKFYGIDFAAIGKGVLAKDKKSFKGITLVAEGIDDKLVGSLIDAEKLEKITDKEIEALRAAVAEKEAK